jgi:acetyl-CoA synthetase
MDLLYKKFVQEEFDENGRLKRIQFTEKDDYNFGFDVVDALAEKSPDKTALLWVGDDFTEKRFSFADIKKYSNKTANYFLSLGIKKGDKVMLVLRRRYQFWFSMIALHKIGAVAVPATDQLMEKDFVYRYEVADVKAIVCTSDGETYQRAESAMKKGGHVKIKIIAHEPRNGWKYFDEGIEKMSDLFERPTGAACPMKNEPMLMYFTSGTTSNPKLAQHPHTYSLGHIVTAAHWHNVDPDGVHLTIAETGWGKAVWGKLYGQWFCETCIFVYDFSKFEAHNILPMFKKYNITTFCAPPTIFRFLIKEDLAKYDLSSLKYATVAGEALNAEVFNKFYDYTHIKLMEGFGQTETTLLIANLMGDEPKPGSMGKPNPQYDVVILNDEGNEVSAGQAGEICVRIDKKYPYGLFSGYYENGQVSLKSNDESVYHTGDMAWRDEEGYFWYEGRKDDLIKSSGYRISPFEIESVIMELPYVLECAATGVKDELRGQVVKASIVLTKDAKWHENMEKEVQDYVKHNTAPYKYPRIVEFVETLPKTISGKIRRVEIRNASKQ